MNGIKTALTALALGGLLFLLLLFPASSMQGAREGLALFGNSVLPALLPFFVLSSLLSQSGLLFSLGPIGKMFGKPFRLGSVAGGALPLCLLTGAPNCARLTADLYKQGMIDSNEAARLLAAGTLTGPLFLIGTAGALLGSSALGAYVYGIQLLCALLNGILWRFYGKKVSATTGKKAPSSTSLFQALPKALTDSCSAILLVGCAVCVFSSLYRLLSDQGLWGAIGEVLSDLLPAQAIEPIAAGLMEISIGVKAVCLSPLPLSLRLSLLCALAGFGGFSILSQSACFLNGVLPVRIYALQRLTHGVLCFCLCRISLLFTQPALPAWAALTPYQPPELSILSYGSLLLLGIASLLLRARKGATSARR